MSIGYIKQRMYKEIITKHLGKRYIDIQSIAFDKECSISVFLLI